MPKISILVTSRVEGNTNSEIFSLFESLSNQSFDHRNFEVLIKYDTDDSLADEVIRKIELMHYPFSIYTCKGVRGRGYIDIHDGYNMLLNMVHPDSEIIGAMADDFRVVRNWDKAILDSSQGLGEFFIIHQRPHPRKEWPNGIGNNYDGMKEFDMSNNMFDSSELHIIDEAPLWSKGLIKQLSRLDLGVFPVSFTDAWTVCLEYVLWNIYQIRLTAFLDKIYITRTTGPMDQDDNERWHTDRKVNFEYINSQEFIIKINHQARCISEAVKNELHDSLSK